MGRRRQVYVQSISERFGIIAMHGEGRALHIKCHWMLHNDKVVRLLRFLNPYSRTPYGDRRSAYGSPEYDSGTCSLYN